MTIQQNLLGILKIQLSDIKVREMLQEKKEASIPFEN
jgi:hypothetical protein